MQLVLRYFNPLLKAMLLPIMLLVAWHQSCAYLNLSNYLLPTPLMVFDALFSMISSGELLEHIVASLSRVFIGFSLDGWQRGRRSPDF